METIKGKKLIIHCCGGTGISIIDKSMDFFKKRDIDRKAELEIKALDTSNANFRDTRTLKDIKNCFFRIENNKLANSFLDGSGGVRSHSAESIIKGVQNYMDENGYTEPKRGELHIVLASASGGSGNVIATTLLSNMINKNIPVLIILVGDDASAKYCENTSKTLRTVNNIAQKADTVVALSYFLNNRRDLDRKESYKHSQEKVDASIAILIDVLRIFNGHPRDLDFQDIKNLINPKLSDFSLDKGVYMLHYNIGEIVEDENSNTAPVISRTIIMNHEEYQPLSITHSKIGYADDTLEESILEHYGTSNINLVLSIGTLKYEIQTLNNRESAIQDRISKMKDSLNLGDCDGDELIL